MALLQLAIAVATGTDWLGTFAVGSPGRVLAVFGEEDEEELWRRTYNATRLPGMRAPAPGSIVTLPLAGVHCAMLERDDRGNPVESAFTRWLREYLGQPGDPWSLIILDPLSRFSGPDVERDNAVATTFVEVVESLAVQTGATSLLSHHTNQAARTPGAKLDATSGRGVTGLYDGPRWQAGLSVQKVALDDAEERERLGRIFTFAQTKSNYSRAFEPVLLRQADGGPFVPLDETDLALVERARGRDPDRERRQGAKDAESSARQSVEDRAVIQAIHERPGIPTRDLAKRVQAIAHCGGERALVAIARVAPHLDIRPGARQARLHYPPPAIGALPGHLSGA
jgi:RecA-family ATPase